jgi:hypothetical protein
LDLTLDGLSVLDFAFDFSFEALEFKSFTSRHAITCDCADLFFGASNLELRADLHGFRNSFRDGTLEMSDTGRENALTYVLGVVNYALKARLLAYIHSS